MYWQWLFYKGGDGESAKWKENGFSTNGSGTTGCLRTKSQMKLEFQSLAPLQNLIQWKDHNPKCNN